MREIKFRAWDDEECKMTQPFYLGSILSERCGDNHFHPMQYTGLKDKNGKEIYEGDIINLGEKNIGQVEWVESRFVMVLSYATFQLSSEGEVIGNIYENPELLKANNAS